MSNDITTILAEWAFDPDEINVRVIVGDDGRERVQIRVELGVLQLEMHGRPDGERPEGRESWLEVYEDRCRRHEASRPDEPPLVLSLDDCGILWREGVQYYHRYLSFWRLKMYEFCARDTARNLRLFDLVRTHAKDPQHKLQFDQWRPYVLMMHARAVATPLAEQRLFEAAIGAVEAAIDAIRDFLDEYGATERAAQSPELANLERWRDELRRQQIAAEGPTQKTVESLKRQLAAAIEREEFEEAARLRDELRALTDLPAAGE